MGVIERLATAAARHGAISLLLAAYVVLSATELVRILLYDGPRTYEAGFYPVEKLSVPTGRTDFRWTRGTTGELLSPLYGPVVRIPVFVARSDAPTEGVQVDISVGGHVADTVVVYAGQWQTLDYYAPVMLGHDPWREDAEAMSLEGFAVLGPVRLQAPFRRPRLIQGGAPDYVRVLTGWHAPPGPPSVWFRFHTDNTFVPAELAMEPGGDRRELGVGIGELLWLSEFPARGIGLHRWEEDGQGRFVWTKGRASLRVRRARAGRTLRVSLSAPPDPNPEPLAIAMYWNAELLETRTLAAVQGWVDVDLLPPAGLPGQPPGVLTVDVSRTWNPARAGVSVDGRDLGVAIRAPRWLRPVEVVEP
jgi:hypothetical protein